ncbi:WD40 repeat-like protein [Trichoderma chlorosporum]
MYEGASNIITGNRFGNNNNIHQGNVVHNHSAEDEAAKCLLALRTTDPRDDKTRIESTKGGLLKDSYKWILEHSDFQQWRDEDGSRLLWIKGDPGKGKTMLLCGIINELSPQKNGDTLVCYFFCQATDSRINSAAAVLRGLIYLAIDQQPLLISHVQKKYKHGGDTLFKDINAWTALSEIFLNILNDARIKRISILIDALDECITDLPNLLDFISTNSAISSHVKWIVSSRNWPTIEEHLNPATQKTKLRLELNESSISEAVNIYIKYKVEQLAQKRAYDTELKYAIQQQLSSRSNNTFLWVALVCQNLERFSLQDILQKLNEFPPGLDSLYERMMDQIRDLENDDGQFCFQILATVLLVYQPVTLTELSRIVEPPRGDSVDLKLISTAIGLCGSFLTIRDERVYIIHQSAKDYLNETTSTFLPLGTAKTHSTIVSRSLSAMSAVLIRNIYELDFLRVPFHIIKAPDPDPLEGIHYSCIYWISHFCELFHSDDLFRHQRDHRMSQMILSFLQNSFLYWLEALALIGHMEDGVLSLIQLDILIKEKPPSLSSPSLLSPDHPSPDPPSPGRQLLELIQDSRRFIQQHSRAIANNPLQAYSSALIFSPSNSLIRKLFEKEEPGWLKLKPVVDYDWSPCLQTIEGLNSGTPIASSSDGHVASASWSGIIKIWDAKTGRERQKFTGHEAEITSIAFSSNGSLASASKDETIKIWDIKTCKQWQTIETHDAEITSIAFSTEGYLASISNSEDTTIKIWDSTTGRELRTLKGHTNKVTSIAFSLNGHLASGSYDETVKIWDIKSGKEWRTLKGHNEGIKSVTFSPDGRLASGSLYGIIDVWDITTGERLRRVRNYYRGRGRLDKGARAIALFKNKIIALDSSGLLIQIWDITTGEIQRTIRAPSPIHSIALSEDGQHLAAGHLGWVIKIWDVTTTGKEKQTYKGLDQYKELALTKDGRHLASVSADFTIKIWDTDTGKEEQNLKGHTDKVCSIAFSADGRQLASGSSDCTIKIWDARRGKIVQTIKVRETVTAVNFSADGLYIASSELGNRSLEIWDAKRGTHLQSLQSYTHYATSIDLGIIGPSETKVMKVRTTNALAAKRELMSHDLDDDIVTLAFSADGRHLASGSEIGVLTVWDIRADRELRKLIIYTKPHSIFFDKLDIEHQSAADAQAISLSTNSAQDQDEYQEFVEAERTDYFGYGISRDKCWITWNGRGILWVPPEYRPTKTSVIWPSPSSTLLQPPSTDTVICLNSSDDSFIIGWKEDYQGL